MEHEPQKSRHKGRETILTLSLVLILGGAFVFFLNLISMGIFFYVIVVVLGIACVGFAHYVLWGYALSEHVAGEREEYKIRESLEADARKPDDQRHESY